MNKIFAILMTLVMLLGCAAMAEAVEMVPVTFEDGFQVSLPSDWYAVELTEENYKAGIFYAACSGDLANTMQISWHALDGERTIYDAQAELVGTYPDAEVYELNGIGLVGFTDEENDLFGYVALDATEPGMYTFWFTPASDDGFIDTAALILGSICNVEI